ncbi:hypothetical protein ASD80_07915 [Devosia sp. Root635]|nr:hypothetical protein ASD80_07915 [Devosia sp. Root635]
MQAATGLTSDEADRLQDDWLIGSKTLEDAEARLAAVIRAYQELGLDINGRKTGIRHVSESSFPEWRSRLINLKSGRALTGDRLQEYLKIAINEQIRSPADSVLAYVYAVLIASRFNWDDIPAIQSFVTRSVAVDPRIIDSACILLLNLNHEGFKLDKDRIASRFVPMLEQSLESGHTFEAIWSLHLLRGLRHDLAQTRVSDLADVNDGSALKIVLLDLRHLGLLPKLPEKSWLKQLGTSQFHDPSWLLAYEGVRHGWLPDAGGVIKTNPLFVPMFSRNVQFYDPKRNVQPRANLRRLRLARAKATHRARLVDWFGDYP